VEVNVLLDTNVLVYHVAGDPAATRFLDETIARRSFCLSTLTVIEFLGWHGHTDDEFVKCKELIELATIFPISKEVADKAIELRRAKKDKAGRRCNSFNRPDQQPQTCDGECARFQGDSGPPNHQSFWLINPSKSTKPNHPGNPSNSTIP